MAQHGNDTAKDSYFTRNAAATAGGEFFWGIGMPVVMESTFLQVFLRNLGASSLVVGLVPTFFFLGISVFGLLSGYLTGHLPNKRRVIVITHLYGALPIPVFGLILVVSGSGPGTLPLFLVMYGLFSLGVGLILPVWQNYLVKLFSEARIFRAMAVIMFTQSAARLLSSFLILGTVKKYSMDPKAAGFIFLVVGVSFLIGTLLYLVTREVDDTTASTPKQKNFFRHLVHAGKTIFGNKNFLRYLASDIETFAVVGIISFYANYAVEHCGITAAAASGLFVACMYAGHLTVHFLFGWLNVLQLKGKFLAGKTASFAGLILLVTFQSLPVFLLVSFLLGFARGIRTLGYPPAVKRITGVEDATLYFSVAPVLVLPFSAGLPVVSGILLDRLERLGGLSYRLIFAFYGLIMALGLFFLFRTRFPRITKEPRRKKEKTAD